MVLSTVFTAFADVAEVPETDAEIAEVLYEDEEGGVYVTYGAEEADGELLGGVVNDDYPVISDFQVLSTGTLGQGDKVSVSFKATDKNGIKASRTSVFMRRDSREYASLSGFTYSYDEATGIITAETYINDKEPGSYYVYGVRVYDTCGFYSYYYASSVSAAQTVFPGYVTIGDKKLISDFAFTENGQTLKPGDSIHVSFKLDIEGVYNVDAFFVNGGENIDLYWGSIGYNNLTYDPATGIMSGSYELRADQLNGTYEMSVISVRKEIAGAGTKSFYHYFDDAEVPAFTLTDATAVVDPWLKNLVLDADGKTLADHDLAKLDFELAFEEVESIRVYFYSNYYTKDFRYYSWEESDQNTLSYDPATKKASVSFNALNELGLGDAYLARILVNYSQDDDYHSVEKKFDSKEHAFTVITNQQTAVTEFGCLEKGKAVQDGDTVHFTAKLDVLDQEQPISSVDFEICVLPDAVPAEDGTVKVTNGVTARTMAAVYNPETGLWEAEYTFAPEEVYGVYYVSAVDVHFADDSFYMDCVDQITEQWVLFAESRDVNFLYFDMQGHGTQIPYQIVASGSVAKKPADPKASGYTFGGWFTEALCENAWDFVEDVVTETMTLFAKWTQTGGGVVPGSGSGSGSGTSVPVVKPDPAVTPITVAANGNQMQGTSVISRPISKLTAEERASFVEKGAWTKDAYGRWTLKKDGGTQVKAGWALVSDAISSKPTGNASWYYFDANGYMLTGWQWIKAADGKQYCYYFNKEDGSMYGACLLGGTTKDNYNLNAKGRWTDAAGKEQTK